MTKIVECLLTGARAFFGTLTEMAPYLLFGFAAAGLISVFISPGQVRRHLGGHSLWPVLKAALFGVPLPLCSCSVIPVTVSLLKHGASRGAATAFLLSTPQTGVDSIIVTYGMLGPVFGIVRPLAAFIAGVLGGSAVALVEGKDGAGTDQACTDECCAHDGGNRLTRAVRFAFITLPRDLAQPLLIGLLIAGVIAAVTPDDYFAGALGTGIVPMLVMLAVGIPMYVCSTASVPIAVALMAKGLSPGAALVFLIAGSGTNAAGVAAVWKIMGARATLIYLASVAVTALLSGGVLNLVVGMLQTRGYAGVHCAWETPGWLEIGATIALCAVLGYALLRPWLLRRRHAHSCCGHAQCGD
jgi:uncharacterized membrane protein YraQ (UPF0718 family)